jgi:hypothetical protein
MSKPTKISVEVITFPCLPSFPILNVLIDYGRDHAVQMKLDSAEKSGATFVIAPLTMTELTVGVVNGGAPCFQTNKKIFPWL